MIHSLAGGSLQPLKINNYVKVELLEGNFKGEIYWYKTTLDDLKPNDIVIVPFGKLDTLLRAKVIRMDKNVSSQASPVPSSRAKWIYSREKY